MIMKNQFRCSTRLLVETVVEGLQVVVAVHQQ